MRTLQLIGIVPAAGLSRRMGRQKLLLPIDGQTAIQHLLDQLRHPALSAVLILVSPDDHPLRAVLQQVGMRDRQVIIPSRPPADMKASVQLLLDHAHQQLSPDGQNDGWLLIPADHPVVDRSVLHRLISHWWQQPDRIVVPTHAGRRGHPTIFPWRYSTMLSGIPANQGLNWLLQKESQFVIEVPCLEESILWDMDTPADYQQILEKFQAERRGIPSEPGPGSQEI